MRKDGTKKRDGTETDLTWTGGARLSVPAVSLSPSRGDVVHLSYKVKRWRRLFEHLFGYLQAGVVAEDVLASDWTRRPLLINAHWTPPHGGQDAARAAAIGRAASGAAGAHDSSA